MRLPGLARSLLVKRQRALLDAIGVQAGTPVVYLKAAWADPVLYGGRGERSGVDIDVLVSPAAYDGYARLMRHRGFIIRPLLHHHALRGHAFTAPAGMIDVDLHRAIAQPPWFVLDELSLLKRARYYDSVDGKVLGLAPDDQIVHAAAHYTGGRFTLDDRHLGDVVRLLQQFEVDWSAIDATCSHGHLGVGLRVLMRMLRDRGAHVPELPQSPGVAARLRLLERLFNVPGPRRFWTRSAVANVRLDLLTYYPVVSTRPTALPRFLVGALAARVRLPRGYT